jgi:glycine cleavage system H lipoate-binding protein
MRCPFLEEAEVQYCGHSMLRKLIVRKPQGLESERCSTPAFVRCPVLRQELPQPAASACPHLRNSLVQYCKAAPVTKYVPYSEEILSRCGRDTFRYCDVYLTMAHPSEDTPEIDGLPLPQWLRYSPNHMWLDTTGDGLCHVGIDALLAKVLHRVDRVAFLTTRGEQRPAAVLSAAGIDLQVLFPNPIRITATNAYLRADPARLTADPYRLGWLFEGVPAGGDRATAEAGLLAYGEAATQWMNAESERLSRFVHELASGAYPDCALMADGGDFSPDLLQHLSRNQILDLFHAFFSPSVEWKRSYL